MSSTRWLASEEVVSCGASVLKHFMRCLTCPCLRWCGLFLFPSLHLLPLLLPFSTALSSILSPFPLLRSVLLLAFNRFFGVGIEPDIMLMLRIYSATKLPAWCFSIDSWYIGLFILGVILLKHEASFVTCIL